MTDSEHPAMHSVQASRAHAEVDRTEAQAYAAQLVEVHDPVLSRGKPRDPRDPRVGSCRVANVPHANT